jgi:hypothetical protein
MMGGGGAAAAERHGELSKDELAAVIAQTIQRSGVSDPACAPVPPLLSVLMNLFLTWFCQTTKAASAGPCQGPTRTTSSAVRHYPRATADGWEHEVAATTQSALRTSGLHHRTRVPRTMRAHTSKSPPFVTARWTGACLHTAPLLRFGCGQLPAVTERAKDADACGQVGQASPRARTVVRVEHHTPSHKLVEQRCVPLVCASSVSAL